MTRKRLQSIKYTRTREDDDQDHQDGLGWNHLDFQLLLGSSQKLGKFPMGEKPVKAMVLKPEQTISSNHVNEIMH